MHLFQVSLDLSQEPHRVTILAPIARGRHHCVCNDIALSDLACQSEIKLKDEEFAELSETTIHEGFCWSKYNRCQN